MQAGLSGRAGWALGRRRPLDVRADTGRLERLTAYTDASVAGGLSLAGLLVDLSIGRRFSKTIPEVLLWGILAGRSWHRSDGAAPWRAPPGTRPAASEFEVGEVMVD